MADFDTFWLLCPAAHLGQTAKTRQCTVRSPCPRRVWLCLAQGHARMRALVCLQPRLWVSGSLPPLPRPGPRACSSTPLFDAHGEPVPPSAAYPRYDKSMLKQGRSVAAGERPLLTKEVAPVVFSPAQEAAARWLFDDRTQLSWAMCATVDELTALNESGTLLPEVCFFGKSNAGKSSLLNALLRARAARVGARPGVTQAVHMLELRGMLRLVDLPGYGHAAASAPDLVRLTRLLQSYLGLPSIARPQRRYVHLPPAASAKARARARALLRSQVQRRESLILLCVLIDARRGVGEHEEALFDDLDALGTPYVLVLTKCDKLKDAEVAQAREQVEASLHKHPRAYPEAICTSALTGEGVVRLRTLLAQAVRPMAPSPGLR